MTQIEALAEITKAHAEYAAASERAIACCLEAIESAGHLRDQAIAKVKDTFANKAEVAERL